MSIDPLLAADVERATDRLHAALPTAEEFARRWGMPWPPVRRKRRRKWARGKATALKRCRSMDVLKTALD